MNKSILFSIFSLLWAVPLEAKIISMGLSEESNERYEIPRSQIKTYIQRGSISDNLKPIKAVKPTAFSDEELISVPERYLSPSMRKKQKAAKKRIAKQKKQRKIKRKIASKKKKAKKRDKVRIRLKSNKIVEFKLEDTVWVPQKSNKKAKAKLLAPKRLLPDVEKLEIVKIENSKSIRREIYPGDRDEIHVLFKYGKTKSKRKKLLLKAYKSYKEKDYASAVTHAVEILSGRYTKKTKRLSRYVLAHSLYQSGFYSSALSHLVLLSTSKWRRSAIGMAAKAIEKTRDDSAANKILSKVSISQIPEEYKHVFRFHLGRILLNSGAGDAAYAAFSKVDEGHARYPEAQYYMGVVQSSQISNAQAYGSWDNPKSIVYKTRMQFENALTTTRTADAKDLKNLAHLSLARLAYQAKQFNQSTYHYRSVEADSPFAREALFETAWALYRLGEHNRSLGGLHSIGSSYFESHDLPEVWVLRSLNYLKLCRFEEANRAANTFELLSKRLEPQLNKMGKKVRSQRLRNVASIQDKKLPPWVHRVFDNDPVVIKDRSRESLLIKERDRLQVLRLNERVKSPKLRNAVADALQKELNRKISSIAKALKPYLVQRMRELAHEYRNQRERLDLLRYEIYSQASRYPSALERPEAKKLIAKEEFLPGVFLKGHEILWRYDEEYWIDEVKGYDYFIPTECLKDRKLSSL